MLVVKRRSSKYKKCTNFNVVGFTRLVLGPMVYGNRGEHANHYTTDEVRVYVPILKLTIL